eukprot:GILJ01013879.1.p2 GENE.GILJ01013879.1~~GILJ01013879.1.p2  ORF type:complete len:105 (+),score=4.46 GILJ01013879.1:267-581(+)
MSSQHVTTRRPQEGTGVLLIILPYVQESPIFIVAVNVWATSLKHGAPPRIMLAIAPTQIKAARHSSFVRQFCLNATISMPMKASVLSAPHLLCSSLSSCSSSFS